MANTNAQMAEFAENLWNNYIREKHNQENADAVSFYRAKVTAKPGGNFLTIQRPYDNAITVPCTTDMSSATVGSQVLVVRFGNGNNNANHLVVAKGDGDAMYPWVQNTVTQNGYVPAPTSSNPYRVYSTDASGVPAWSNRGMVFRTVGNITDVDDISSPCIIQFNSADINIPNLPVAQVGTLITLTTSANINEQIYIPRPDTNNRVYMRKKESTTWGSWIVLNDLTNMFGTLPIANGGTNATTASAALTNLGAMARSYDIVTDLDATFSNGPYRYLSSATGAPTTDAGGALFVYRYNENYVNQIAFINSSYGSNIIVTRQYYNGTWSSWKPLDSQLEGFRSVDGSSFNKDFLTVNPSGTFDRFKQQAAFYWSASTSSDFSNIPDGLPTGGSVVGFREVFYRSSIHILVKVTEMYPVAGREHYNFYNNGSWSGWNTAIPNSYMGDGVGDLDTMPTRGLFGTFFTNMSDSGITGTKPNTSGAGLFFCLRQSSNITRQIYMPRNHSTVDHYWRYYTHSTGVWTAWDTIYKITDVSSNTSLNTVSVNTSTWTSVGSQTFLPGSYVIKFLASFTSNATGSRQVTITGTEGAEGAATDTVKTLAATGVRTNVEVVAMRQFTSNTTLYFNVWQNSGSALSTYGRLSYIRMGY